MAGFNPNAAVTLKRYSSISSETNRSKRTLFVNGHVGKNVHRTQDRQSLELRSQETGSRGKEPSKIRPSSWAVLSEPEGMSAEAIVPMAIDPVATAIGIAGQINTVLHTAQPALQNIPWLGGAFNIAAMIGYGVEGGVGAIDHIRELRKSAPAETADSQPPRERFSEIDTGNHFVQKDRKQHQIQLFRTLSEMTRCNVNIASSIAGFCSTTTAAIVSTSLGVASGALGTLIGGVSCALYGLKARKFDRRLKAAEKLQSPPKTDDAEKAQLFKILDGLRIDRFRKQRNSARVSARVYGGIGALGLLGAVMGGLSLAGLVSSGIATAGAVPGLIFTAGVLVWGGYSLVRAIKQHQGQKVLQRELEADLKALEDLDKEVQGQENKVKNGGATDQNQPGENDSPAEMDRKLFNFQDQRRDKAQRVEFLLEKYLKSNPATAVRCVLQLLPSSREEVKKYFESRCTDHERFEDSFQLLEKQWNSTLDAQQKLDPLGDKASEKTKAQQKILAQLQKPAIRTACKILGL